MDLFLFSGFNRFMHFLSTYANSWIKIAARSNTVWPGLVSGGDSAAGRTRDGPDNHWGSSSIRWGGWLEQLPYSYIWEAGKNSGRFSKEEVLQIERQGWRYLKTDSDRESARKETDRIRRTNADNQQQKLNCVGHKETTILKKISKDWQRESMSVPQKEQKNWIETE
jgi:hypothetical protein